MRVYDSWTNVTGRIESDKSLGLNCYVHSSWYTGYRRPVDTRHGSML